VVGDICLDSLAYLWLVSPERVWADACRLAAASFVFSLYVRHQYRHGLLESLPVDLVGHSLDNARVFASFMGGVPLNL
jgi:hypothetical protein